MNSNILLDGMASRNLIGSHDAETITADTVALGIEPTDENVERVGRAMDILIERVITPIANFDDDQIYFVPSQDKTGTRYIVLRNGSVQCTCSDYKHRQRPCKHGIAVLLAEQEQQRDAAMCDAYDKEI